MQTLRQYITTGRHSLLMENNNCTPYLGRGKGIVHHAYTPSQFGQDPASKARRAELEQMNRRASKISFKIK